MSSPEPNRCRLVLVVPADAGPQALASALAGGDVASVIICATGDDEAGMQTRMQALVMAAQQAGAAALTLNNTRMAGRTGADGVHLEGDLSGIGDLIARGAGKAIVGAGGMKTRHHALEIGEARPDYVMFGEVGGDTHPQANPKNLDLGQWWAELVEIPCIVLGGSGVESVTAAAETGAEFVALSAAVFAGADPAGAVRHANALLDASAPRFET
jgi:thiamine-phosphate pyrophosphorylase